METRSKLRPREIAKLWGISPDKVVGWIRSGELPAIDASQTVGGRPRYLVDVSDLEAFERRRLITPPTPSSPRRRTDEIPQYV